MSNRCIIDVAFGSDYERKQVLLMDSLADKFDGSLLFYRSEAAVSSPMHCENPFAFKIGAFDRAVQEGFRQILWIDANVRVDGSLAPVWDAIAKDGYYFINSGNKIGEWSSDITLAAFGVSREDALLMPELAAYVIGLDFDNELALRFYNRWKWAMNAGLFRGEWLNDHHQVSIDGRVKGHRHDQTCASLAAHQLGITNFHEGVSWYQSGGTPKPESTIFVKT
jgi:hypothetical protein